MQCIFLKPYLTGNIQIEMKNAPKIKLTAHSQSDKLEKETQSIFQKYTGNESVALQKSAKNWRAKIQKLTLRIEDQYPELYECLEKMPVIVPDEKKFALAEMEFKKYYNYLSTLLKKYILEYPKHSGYEK